MNFKKKVDKAKMDLFTVLEELLTQLDKTVEKNQDKIDKVSNAMEKGAQKMYVFMENADKKLEEAVISLHDMTEDVSARTKAKVNDLKGNFYTDQKYDPKKTQAFLQDTSEQLADLTSKAITGIHSMGIDLAKAIVMKYHKIIPYSSELKDEGRYAGIGTRYNGPLIRDSYERCLKYHGEAQKLLKPDAKFRKEILADIKASASTSTYELKLFYLSQNSEIYLDRLIALTDQLRA